MIRRYRPIMLLLLVMLLLKHFVFDFVYQPPYQWMNKGTYGHLGGLLHAGQHGLATFVILLAYLYWWSDHAVMSDGHGVVGVILFLFTPFVAASEFVIHYHVDWAKMNLNKKMGWGATTHNQFWVLLGLDQLLHSLTYIWIVSLFTR